MERDASDQNQYANNKAKGLSTHVVDGEPNVANVASEGKEADKQQQTNNPPPTPTNSYLPACIEVCCNGIFCCTLCLLGGCS